MRKTLLYISTLILLPLVSCNKWLDVNPETQVPKEDMFQKEKGFEGALIGCYTKLNSSSLYGQNMTITILEFMSYYWTPDPLNHTVEKLIQGYNYGNVNVQNVFKGIYNQYYNTILQANDVLEHIDDAESVVKSKLKRDVIKGEALALRAFCHFDLLRLFGQMPKNPKITVSLAYAETTGPENKPRYAYEQFIKKIETDLLDAEQFLQEDPVKEYGTANFSMSNDPDIDPFFLYRKFRFNYFAVKALQARFYLYIGDIVKAKEAALTVINAKIKDTESPAVELAGNADFEAFHNALPTETIMGLSNSRIEEYINDLFTGYPKLEITKEHREDMFSSIETEGNNRYKSNLWSSDETPVLQKYFQEKKPGDTDDETKLNYRWFIPVLRLSEMYLIAMECSKDLTEINGLYTTYMLARGKQVDGFDNIEDAHNEVINEYRREFIAEGQMFFVYKRLGSEKIMWSTKNMTDNEYVVPIPTSEIK